LTVGLCLAEFENADALRAAAERAVEAGYSAIETYTPFPVPGLERYSRRGRNSLPGIVLVGGILGGLASYGIQFYANVVSYPLNSGGRPPHAILAFIPATFEGTVLGAGVAAFLGFCYLLRLPSLWHPLFEIDGFERASIDRFWLSLAIQGTAYSRIAELLTQSGALRVVEMSGP
jgi:hypothetical protein